MLADAYEAADEGEPVSGREADLVGRDGSASGGSGGAVREGDPWPVRAVVGVQVEGKKCRDA